MSDSQCAINAPLGACSNYGTCVNGICQCDAGYQNFFPFQNDGSNCMHIRSFEGICWLGLSIHVVLFVFAVYRLIQMIARRSFTLRAIGMILILRLGVGILSIIFFSLHLVGQYQGIDRSSSFVYGFIFLFVWLMSSRILIILARDLSALFKISETRSGDVMLRWTRILTYPSIAVILVASIPMFVGWHYHNQSIYHRFTTAHFLCCTFP